MDIRYMTFAEQRAAEKQAKFDVKMNVLAAAVSFGGFAYVFCKWWFQW